MIIMKKKKHYNNNQIDVVLIAFCSNVYCEERKYRIIDTLKYTHRQKDRQREIYKYRYMCNGDW